MRFPDDVPALTAGDITLRAHRVEDADAIVEQCIDPVSIQSTTVPLGYDHAMAIDWVTTSIPEMWATEKEFCFAIESTYPDGVRRFSGTLSLRDEGARRAELAFGAHPAIRGRGVMTTAVNLLLDWGFAERDLETVIWWANKGNLGSRRVAWKTGFTFGGTVRKWLEHRDEYPDAWVAALHKSDPRQPSTPWYEVPRIVGENVVLRPFEDKDIPRIVEACTDERTQHWLSFLPNPYTEQDAREYLERVADGLAEGTRIQWCVADPDTDVLLANVGLPRMGRREAEIGYLGHPSARGRGVMREAVSLVVRHAFLSADDGGLGLRRLHLKAAFGNKASQYVARANGFTEYGRERESELLGDGSYDDMVVFDLLASEWLSRYG